VDNAEIAGTLDATATNVLSTRPLTEILRR
jgi:hypothetical protein